MKKSQAAMEFLMTYGWAILIIAIALSALFYFGVFDFTALFPGTCTIPSGISCEQHSIKQDRVFLVLRNDQAFDMKDITIEIEGCGTYTPGTDLLSMKSELYNITCDDSLKQGSRFRGTISIQYEMGDPGLEIPYDKKGKIAGYIE